MLRSFFVHEITDNENDATSLNTEQSRFTFMATEVTLEAISAVRKLPNSSFSIYMDKKQCRALLAEVEGETKSRKGLK